MTQPHFKTIVCGAGGCGKSEWLRRLSSGPEEPYQFDPKYTPTLGVNVQPLTFTLHEAGNVVFDVWDLAGQEKYQGLRDGYFIGADAAIIAFDLTSPNSFKAVETWYRDLMRMFAHPMDPARSLIPIILVGMKADIKDRKVHRAQIEHFQQVVKLKYLELSAKSTLNYDKIWLHLTRQVMHSPDLHFAHSISKGEEDPLEIDYFAWESYC